VKEVGWMDMSQDRIQWQALVLMVLNLQILLPESQLVFDLASV
jgi:hypothetical protein